METGALRGKARQSLSGNWWLSIGVGAVAFLLRALHTGVSFLPDLSTELPIPYLQELSKTLNETLSIGSGNLRLNISITGLASLLLGGAVQLGYCQYLLKQHDGKDLAFSDLFCEFHRFGAGFAQGFLRTLYIALWSLLFIIPGIVKGYSYAMTPFLMAEDPSLSANEAITRSRLLMDGHKGELFLLDLTFIGWVLLTILTANLGNLALNPYRNAAYAAFYRELMATEKPVFQKM